jgi:DNA-binding NtrC family response regulator
VEGEHGTVFVVDDDGAQRRIVARWLSDAGHDVVEFADGETSLLGLAGTIPDAVCLDLRLPGIDGLETLDRIRAHNPRVPVIMLTVDDAVEPVVAAVRLGAFEYLRKPLDRQKLLTTVRNAVASSQMSVRLAQLEHEVEGWSYPNIVGRSEPMRALFRQMDRVAPTDVTVLIRGESGTGKELVARALHDSSGRRSGPFVAINCAAIPESLQESELFGHERGAFTGATQRRPGRFEQADQGTLFLDEIAELSPGLQAKLLRAIQERRFFRVGGDKEVRSDFRLITATHRDLSEEVEQERFREDLFFRLAVLELVVPPLRDRGADIALLAKGLAQDLGVSTFGRAGEFSPAALRAITSYSWPGNVRELQNAVQRAVVLAPEGTIPVEALPEPVQSAGAAWPDERRAGTAAPEGPGASAAPGSVPDSAAPWAERIPDLSLEALEKGFVQSMLTRHHGNLSAVARTLGISRTTLYRKLDAYDIPRNEA